MALAQINKCIELVVIRKLFAFISSYIEVTYMRMYSRKQVAKNPLQNFFSETVLQVEGRTFETIFYMDRSSHPYAQAERVLDLLLPTLSEITFHFGYTLLNLYVYIHCR